MIRKGMNEPPYANPDDFLVTSFHLLDRPLLLSPATLYCKFVKYHNSDGNLVSLVFLSDTYVCDGSTL